MPEPVFGNVREYTVSELSGALRRVVEDGFGFVRVRGEISNVKRHSSGHLYFDLKDLSACIAGVMWKTAASRLKIAPEQGLDVVAAGRLTTYAAQSKYQLIIDSLEPAGVGALMALLEERKRKLAAEGLFAAERKRPLPFLPAAIGVVTSPTGAVIRDILHRLRERSPCRVLVWPTPVQGKGAEARIAAAIAGFNALPEVGPVPRPDVLIVARGGGSIEDLWCFNEEIVVRAAAASRIPVISAVGHETDTTLIDLAADRRAPTPSAAAELAVPVRRDLIERLMKDERRLASGVRRLSEQCAAALRAAARGLGRPEDLIGPLGQRFDRAHDRLEAGARDFLAAARLKLNRASGRLGPGVLAAGFARRESRVESGAARLRQAARASIAVRRSRLAAQRLSPAVLKKRSLDGRNEAARLVRRLAAAADRAVAPKRAALDAAAKLLQLVSYENVLDRGFALVRGQDGRVIARAADAGPGAHVAIRFSDGERGAIIDGTKSRQARPGRAPGVQKSLFD